MTKKNSINLRQIASFALAMIMCLSLALPAFAGPPDPPKYGTENRPADAAITKIFQMPIGTDTPDVEFKFEVDALEVDGEAYDAVKQNMPTVGTINIELDDAKLLIEGEIKKLIIESEKLFAGKTFPHAGVYKYKVTEYDDTFDNTLTEKLTFSEAEYRLEVYVANGDNGPYVQSVFAFIVIHDESNVDNQTGKVDPTPGEDRIEGDYSEMIFTNTYVKTNGKPDIVDPEDPEDPKDPEDPDLPEEIDENSVLSITKMVVGDYASKSLEFTFNVKVNVPAVGFKAGEPYTYTAYVIKVNDNGEPIGYVRKHVFAANPGDVETIKLTHGQRLAFTDMHVGASFSVEEDGTPSYAPSYTLTQGTEEKKGNASTSEKLNMGRHLIVEDDSIVDYENEHDLTTPTGISVDNLPYIALIIAVAFALAGYMVVKLRVKGKTNA